MTISQARFTIILASVISITIVCMLTYHFKEDLYNRKPIQSKQIIYLWY